MRNPHRLKLASIVLSTLLAVIIWSTLGSEAPLRSFPESDRIAGISRGYLYFHLRGQDRIEREPLQGGAREAVTVPGLRTTADLRVFTAHNGDTLLFSPPQPGGPVQARDVDPRLWTVSTATGSVTRLLPRLNLLYAAVSDSYCYWLRPRETKAITRVEGGQQIGYTHLISDLMVTPISGGDSQTVYESIELSTGLLPLGDGISWLERDPRDQARFRRCVAFPPSFQVRKFPSYDGPIARAGDRLLWLIDKSRGTESFVSLREGGREPGSEAATPQIVSSDFEGKDVKVVATPQGFNYFDFQGTIAQRAFGIMSSGGLRNQEHYLFSSDGDTLLQGPRIRRGGRWMTDGSKLYCLSQQHREKWWDFSPSGLSGENTSELFEYELPN